MHRPLSVAVLLVLLATAPANPQQTQWFSQRTRDRIQAALSLAQWIPNLNTAAKILKTIMDVGVAGRGYDSVQEHRRAWIVHSALRLRAPDRAA